VAGEAGRSLVAGIVGAGTEPGPEARGGGSGGVVVPSRLALSRAGARGEGSGGVVGPSRAAGHL